MPSAFPPAGVYGVVKTRGFFPWVVRRATHSWANHAFIFIDDEGAIVEAEPGGVRHNRIGSYSGCRIAVNLGDEMTVDERRAVAQAATDMVGEDYNFLGIVDDGLEALGIPWKWLTRRAEGDHEVLCSQVVALAGHKAGLDWRGGRAGYSEVTPADLARRSGMRPWPAP